MNTGWSFAVYCEKCHYCPVQGDLGNLQAPLFVPEECPKCLENKEEGPPKGPSRFKVWRETRRFRRVLRHL